jgi:hypothetical protein
LLGFDDPVLLWESRENILRVLQYKSPDTVSYGVSSGLSEPWAWDRPELATNCLFVPRILMFCKSFVAGCSMLRRRMSTFCQATGSNTTRVNLFLVRTSRVSW